MCMFYRLEKCYACGAHEMMSGEEGLILEKVDGVLMCQSCKRDYQLDHPNGEELAAAAEYRQDSLHDR
jgi:hypothetical protein